MSEPLFACLDSSTIANGIRSAEHSVCYAGPGIQQEPAAAMVAVARRIGPELITVCIDFDERVMRMGFGSLAAVKTLREAGIVVRSTPGFRTGLVIVDNEGYIFTPIALYLEADRRESDAPNALRLSRDQAAEALARLSPAAKDLAMGLARTPEERERIRVQAVEVRSTEVAEAQFQVVSQKLTEAPPVQFDVARQVRVYEAYLQYVEVKLTGAAIQRRRIAIPPAIQGLGGNDGIADRLKTTFDLVDRDSDLSSKSIENELAELRKNFTPSLGKEHGRVILKAQKPKFEERLAELEKKLETFQANLKEKLQTKIDESRDEIITHFVPIVSADPPDALSGQLLTPKPTEEDVRRWLTIQLERVLPKAEDVITKMTIEKTYKDLTFETLNQDGFLDKLKKAFPNVDWDRPHKEFLTAGPRSG